MAIAEGATEIPDSEDEPMTSSPAASSNGIDDKLRLTAREPLQEPQDAFQAVTSPHQAPGEHVSNVASKDNESLGVDPGNASSDVESPYHALTNFQLDNTMAAVNVDASHMQDQKTQQSQLHSPKQRRETESLVGQTQPPLRDDDNMKEVSEQSMSMEQLSQQTRNGHVRPFSRNLTGDQLDRDHDQEGIEVIDQSTLDPTISNATHSTSLTSRSSAISPTEVNNCRREQVSQQLPNGSLPETKNEQNFPLAKDLVEPSDSSTEEASLSQRTSNGMRELGTQLVSELASSATKEALYAEYPQCTKPIFSKPPQGQETSQDTSRQDSFNCSANIPANSNVTSGQNDLGTRIDILAEPSNTFSALTSPAQSESSAKVAISQEQTMPMKTSQETTLAELKAQKAALIASLAMLPNLQEFMVEKESYSASSEDLNDGHTDASIMTAADKIVKKHIRLLHEYNELKDVGQGLMGLIADQRGVRIIEVQDEFGIGLKD